MDSSEIPKFQDINLLLPFFYVLLAPEIINNKHSKLNQIS